MAALDGDAFANMVSLVADRMARWFCVLQRRGCPRGRRSPGKRAWIGVLASLLALRLTCWGPSPSGSQRWSKKLATSLVLFLAVSLLALQLLHGQVDLQLDQERRQVVDYDTFYDIHRVYLILSTAQWLAAIALTVVLVHGWTRCAISEPRVASPSSEALS
jgi:hypothetical protein